MTPLHPLRLMILVALLIALVAMLVASGALDWFGRLPGDIRIERPGRSIRIPWVSLVVVSAVFNALIWLGRRFLF
jgi:hypothetical protein